MIQERSTLRLITRRELGLVGHFIAPRACLATGSGSRRTGNRPPRSVHS
jgi:hypothetical protein